ncbi:hypothetical protein K2X33_13185 [bacterium]|nr:hypothetical protein [bacterium]
MSVSADTLKISKGGDRLLIALALLFFTMALYGLVNYQPFYEGPAGLVSVGQVTVQGKLRRRHAGSLAWSEIEGEGQIFLRDLVYTPPGVVAEVTGTDGKTMTLPQDSLVQFDEVTVSNLEITLREAAEPKRQVFRLIPLPKAQRSAALPDPIGLEMLYTDVAKNWQKYSGRRVNLDRVRKVAAAQDLVFDKVRDFELLLHYPHPKQEIPYARDNWVKMAWSPMPVQGLRYQVEVSVGDQFAKKVPYESGTNYLEVQFEKPGRYFWRVTANAGDGQVASETREFTLKAVRKEDIMRDVSAKRFDQYHVDVSRTQDFTDIVSQRGANRPECSTYGLSAGVYYCRVKKDAKDRSPMRKYRFEVK